MVRLKKVVAIGFGNVLFVFFAVARNAASVAGGIDASSSVVLIRDGRSLRSFIISTMLGGNGGSTAVPQEQDTESRRHERLTKIRIFIGRMYEVPHRTPSPGIYCGMQSHFIGGSRYLPHQGHAMQSARIARVRTSTVTSSGVLAGSPGEETQSDAIQLRMKYPGQELGIGKLTMVASHCHR